MMVMLNFVMDTLSLLILFTLFLVSLDIRAIWLAYEKPRYHMEDLGYTGSVGQNGYGGASESDDPFQVSGLKVKDDRITGSSVLLFLFQWENKNVDFWQWLAWLAASQYY